MRQHGNRLLATVVEQTFLGEALLELFECELQRAEAGRLNRDGVELELPLLFVDGETPPHDELQSVLDAEAEKSRVRRKEDHAQ